MTKEEIEKKREEIQKLQFQIATSNVLSQFNKPSVFKVGLCLKGDILVESKDYYTTIESEEFKKDLIELVKSHLEKNLSQ